MARTERSLPKLRFTYFPYFVPLLGNHMGGLLSAVQQAFPPNPTWGVDDIPDLTGKVVLVTGACPN